MAVGDAIDLPLHLEVDRVTASIDVVGATTALDSRRTQVAETITPREIDGAAAQRPQLPGPRAAGAQVFAHQHGSNERFAETSAVPGTGISVAGQRNLEQHLHRRRPVGERRCRGSRRYLSTERK